MVFLQENAPYVCNGLSGLEKNTFENLKTMKALDDGFKLEFTEPVNKKSWQLNVTSYEYEKVFTLAHITILTVVPLLF